MPEKVLVYIRHVCSRPVHSSLDEESVNRKDSRSQPAQIVQKQLENLHAKGFPVLLDGRSDSCKRQSAGAWSLLEQAFEENGIRIESGQIIRTELGKPVFKPDRKKEEIFFSLSHHPDYAVVCLASSRCGIDIEKIRPWKKKAGRRICTDDEYEAWQKNGYSDSWITALFTKKEARAKQEGCPLADVFSMDVYQSGCQSIQIEDYWLSVSVKGMDDETEILLYRV